MRTTTLALLALATGIFFSQPLLVHAGCGCSKPPPELADVRPNVTYAGMDVTLFHPSVQSGQSYDVTFASGITGERVTVTGAAVFKRDLADSQAKSQLTVPVPTLPLGPASISVSQAGQSGVLLSVTDDAFTVAPQPLTLPEQVGEAVLPAYQAAVSRAGIVYLSLDVSNIHEARTFKAQAQGYPLRFTNNDLVFYNTQGVLMQLLEEGMPGLFALQMSTGTPDSDILHYSRHEFNTYFVQHAERVVHPVDPSDPQWHLDSTPHIDHNYLIIAVSGMFDDGSVPAPGATPPFTLVLNTFTLFHHGLFGATEVALGNTATTQSYDSTTGSAGAAGDVLSNDTVRLTQSAIVDGDATAVTFDIGGNATVTGTLFPAIAPTVLMPVDMPAALEDLGPIVIKNANQSLTLGPGSYHASRLHVKGGQLIIDNTAGPVTLYLTGLMQIDGNGEVVVLDPNPEKFAVYVASDRAVTLKGQGAFEGVVYAPQSQLNITGQGAFFGSFVGQAINVTGQAQVYFDTALRGTHSAKMPGENGLTGGGDDGGGGTAWAVSDTWSPLATY